MQVFEVEAAYLQASSGGTRPVRARHIYYAIRPKVLAVIKKNNFSDAYFGRLLPEFMQDEPELTSDWRVLFDPRGTLIEPHTGLQVQLGTAGVATYRATWTNGQIISWSGQIEDWEADTTGPHHRYSAAIVSEKEGIGDLLTADKLHERHDVAVKA